MILGLAYSISKLSKQVTQAKINNHQSRPNPVTIGRENRPENIPPNFNVPPPNSYNNEEPRRKPMEEIALEPVHNQRSCINEVSEQPLISIDLRDEYGDHYPAR